MTALSPVEKFYLKCLDKLEQATELMDLGDYNEHVYDFWMEEADAAFRAMKPEEQSRYHG